MYALVLFLHSWVRWAVVLSLVAVNLRMIMGLVRRTSWRPLDRAFALLFLAALHTQIAVGLVMYFGLSALTPKSMADLRAFMSVAPLRFFAVEHLFGMTLATISFHLGWAAGKRARSDRLRYKRVLAGAGVALVLILVSIPWPFFVYGRPVVRLSAP